VSDKPRAHHGTNRLRGERASLPNVQDCHDRANHCLDTWNRSDDHVTGSWLLRMADGWLRLGSELAKQERTSNATATAELRRMASEYQARAAALDEAPHMPNIAAREFDIPAGGVLALETQASQQEKEHDGCSG
jgi:hypothetical protein